MATKKISAHITNPFDNYFIEEKKDEKKMEQQPLIVSDSIGFHEKGSREEDNGEMSENAATGGRSENNYPVKLMYVETKSRRVQLLMQPSLHDAIKRKATGEGISVNDLIHRILEREFKGGR